MSLGRTPEDILRDMMAIPSMERGKLCEMRTKSGGRYYNLQFWREGRNRCEYVSKDRLPAVQNAVANYQRFCELTQEYAAAVEAQTRNERQTCGGSKKNSRTGSRTPPDRK
jgi:hypothetical protein